MSDTQIATTDALEGEVIAPAADEQGTKARFAKALDEAKAGASTLGAQLGKVVLESAAPLREKWASGEIADTAKAYGEKAKGQALVLANDGKAITSDALSSIGKLVSDNAGLIDEHLGAKYGDYARTAARQIQEAAAKFEAKDLAELGTDAKEFVKKNPAVAIGAAAVIGFFLARSLTADSAPEKDA